MGTVSHHLAGAVVVTTLPLLEPPTPATAPVLKRLRLPQGELAQFYDAEEGLCYAAVIELAPGSVRGNHYHKVKRELIYVIRGAFELRLREVDTGATDVISVSAGSSVLIRPGIAHALHVLEAGFAVECSPDRFDPGDTFRHECGSGATG